MKHLSDTFSPDVNFFCCLRDRNGKVVPGSKRILHNVFTDVGRDWIAHLVAWSSLGDPDIAVTQRRVRWVAVGTGLTQEELGSITSIEVPTPIDEAANYLSPVNDATFPPGDVPTTRFWKEFGTEEITLVDNPIVPITEAALFVDVHRADEIGGAEDSPVSGLTTTLNPKVMNNAPVAYARFEKVTKTRDFSFEILWDFRFGAGT